MKLFYYLAVFVLLSSCSGNNHNPKIYVKIPKNIVKIENKHAISLMPESFKIKKEIKSEDCESWQLDYNYKKIFKDSYVKLLNKMFDKIVFTDTKLSNKELENQNFTTFINFKENIFLLRFFTVRNSGVLKISLTSNFIVEGNGKVVKNEIKSEQSWEKNVYFNCKAAEGASKIGEIAFENLMNQAHEKIYSSVINVIR